MKDGIYFVTFSSNMPDNGKGLVVVRDGKLNGGDENYTYRGVISNKKLELLGKRHNKKGRSIFGDLAVFEVEFDISEHEGGYSLSGHKKGSVNAKVLAKARFLDEIID